MSLEQIVIANEMRSVDETSDEAVEASPLRECGCPLEGPCMCGPRLRIFDPMGRLLMSPVYY